MTIEGAHWLPNVGYGLLSADFETYFKSRLTTLTGGDPASQLSQLWVGLCGLACSAVLYLAFLPPAAYVRFVRESAPAPAAGHTP